MHKALQKYFQSLLNGKIWNNTPMEWAEALMLLVVLTLVFTLIKKLLIQRFKHLSEETNGIKALVSEILRSTRSILLFLVALYFAALSIELPEQAKHAFRTIAFAAVVVQVGIWGNYFIREGLRRYMNRRFEEPVSHSGVVVMSLVGRILLWSFVFLMIIDNLGVDITTLVASLGVGGIAIGLATQNILSDLFASLSILLDRPFEPGHFIIVDDYLGTVEHIGLKTTRIRSLSGELLVFGNNDLLQSRIRNFTNFQERRVVFTFGVLYDTSAEKLKRIPGLVREIIENTAQTRFDRAHFKAFGDFSLNFEIVYFVLSPDYLIYMDVQEKINLGIFEAFENEGIGFAFPTRTLHIASQPGGQPAAVGEAG